MKQLYEIDSYMYYKGENLIKNESRTKSQVY